MKELLENVKIIVKQDEIAIASLACEMISLPVDPMGTFLNANHTLFKPGDVNISKGSIPTPYASRIWKAMKKVYEEKGEAFPICIPRHTATDTLLAWEAWLLKNRPGLLDSYLIPKKRTSARAATKRATRKPRRKKNDEPLPELPSIDPANSNLTLLPPQTFLLQKQSQNNFKHYLNLYATTKNTLTQDTVSSI